MTGTARSLLRKLRRADDGVAMIEFAYTLIILLPLFIGGVEITNYAMTKMRVSQIALHAADNASRIGLESLLTKPQITEAQINDLLLGANLQGGDLDFASNGRLIISSVEPMANPNTSNRQRIRWQRCYGSMEWDSSYGDAGDTNLVSVGPPGEQVKAPENGGIMFVEVAYTYQPLFPVGGFVKTDTIHETASMVVRDDRDFTGNNGAGIYNPDGVTASAC